MKEVGDWLDLGLQSSLLLGKIATSTGHSSSISTKESRCRISELRGLSDAIAVRGNIVQKDSTES